jgi:hypothetical protein
MAKIVSFIVASLLPIIVFAKMGYITDPYDTGGSSGNGPIEWILLVVIIFASYGMLLSRYDEWKTRKKNKEKIKLEPLGFAEIFFYLFLGLFMAIPLFFIGKMLFGVELVKEFWLVFYITPIAILIFLDRN